MFLLLILFAPSIFARAGSSESITLENKNIKVVISKEMPSILEYQIKELGGVKLENPAGSEPVISFFKGALPVMENRTKVKYDQLHSDNLVSYRAKIDYNNSRAIEFTLVYALKENGIEVTFNDVIEQPDF